MKEIDLRPQSDADIAVSFNIAELSAVELNVPLLGCIQTAEDPDSMARDDLVEPEIGVLHSKHPHRLAYKQRKVQTHAPTISFSIKSEPAQSIQGASDVVGGSPSKGGVPNASKGSQHQSIVIEARSTEAIVEEGKANNAAKSHGQGVLLGQVILTTEMDKKLIHRHEIRSFYESVVMRNVPIMKITKEFLPISSIYKSSPDRGGFMDSNDRHERGRIDGRDRAVERGDRSRSQSVDRDEKRNDDTRDVYASHSREYRNNGGSGRDSYQQQVQYHEPHTPPRDQQHQQQQQQYDEGKISEHSPTSSPDPVGGMDLRRHNDYLAHANDRVNRHGQHQHYQRESNYGAQGGN